MNAAATRALIVAGALAVLVAANYAIYRKERVIRLGELIYVELLWKHPRFAIQGDHLELTLQLAHDIEATAPPDSSPANTPARAIRRAPLILDNQRVARLARAGEQVDLLIRYRIRNRRVWLGTNAYFFERGAAFRLDEAARYGEFRVDRASGEAVLVALRDRQLRRL